MYEKLLDHANAYKIDVYEVPLKKKIKGLYSDNVIWLNKNQLDSAAKKASVLAEELGHYHTSVGDITDQSKITNRKQELRARIWGYEEVIPLSKIVQAHQKHIKNRYEFADYLGVTESFLDDALERYKDKYGTTAIYENYVISFEPLGVVEWLGVKKI
ncbi:ImmA/IrrE family metallo-endopeptidase [Oceanobacillus jeddahense]|uniref:ImmA/IrrE family metallo-endopeptidase n=1 Tax=Oceanobacillus jeddahense TaxID=1462527 RepID=UPI000595A558|nr:ImmA/IrrE family metallo-endopeptidase [Oceanobacillus jeddahense]